MQYSVTPLGAEPAHAPAASPRALGASEASRPELREVERDLERIIQHGPLREPEEVTALLRVVREQVRLQHQVGGACLMTGRLWEGPIVTTAKPEAEVQRMARSEARRLRQSDYERSSHSAGRGAGRKRTLANPAGRAAQGTGARRQSLRKKLLREYGLGFDGERAFVRRNVGPNVRLPMASRRRSATCSATTAMPQVPTDCCYVCERSDRRPVAPWMVDGARSSVTELDAAFAGFPFGGFGEAAGCNDLLAPFGVLPLYRPGVNPPCPILDLNAAFAVSSPRTAEVLPISGRTGALLCRLPA